VKLDANCNLIYNTSFKEALNGSTVTIMIKWLCSEMKSSVIYQNVPCIFDYCHVIYCWPSSHAIIVVDIYTEQDIVSSNALDSLGINGDKVTVNILLNYPAQSYHQTLTEG
jgi:hypothetical protein